MLPLATDHTALTKKGAKFKWTPNFQAAFDTLKLELSKGVMLTSVLPNPLKFTQMLPNCSWEL